MSAAVLVIDDAPQMRRVLRQFLERAGYVVHEAGDGRAGLDLLRGNAIDLVICDVNMPGLDGIAFLKEVQDTEKKVPVISISGGSQDLPSPVSLTMSSVYGATRTLFKPFRRKEILRCVEEVLEKAR